MFKKSWISFRFSNAFGNQLFSWNACSTMRSLKYTCYVIYFPIPLKKQWWGLLLRKGPRSLHSTDSCGNEEVRQPQRGNKKKRKARKTQTTQTFLIYHLQFQLENKWTSRLVLQWILHFCRLPLFNSPPTSAHLLQMSGWGQHNKLCHYL